MAPSPPSSPALPQHSHAKHRQTNDRTDGQKHIGENPEIGRASSLKKFEQEQQYNARKAGKGDGGANKAYVVTGESGGFLNTLWLIVQDKLLKLFRK